MSFSISSNLGFVDSFLFLSSLLHSLVRNLNNTNYTPERFILSLTYILFVNLNIKLIIKQFFRIVICVKNSNKDGFKYSSQEFDSNVFDLFKQIGICYYKYMNDFEKFKVKLLSKEKSHSLLEGKTLSDKEFKHVLMFWNKFEMKVMKDYHDFC